MTTPIKTILILAIFSYCTACYGQFQDSSKLTNPMGFVFNKKTYQLLVKRRINKLKTAPIQTSYSLKKYCPSVYFQSGGTCFAYASAYAARSILYNITIGDSTSTDSNRFSPGFLVNMVQPKTISNLRCRKGADIEDACLAMERNGIVKLPLYPDECSTYNYTHLLTQAAPFKIKSSGPIFEICDDSASKINAVKNAISSNRPVIIAINTLQSFHKAYGKELWEPLPSEKKYYDCRIGNHAICVVGYDDNIFGGSVEIMNSWGNTWGKNGFIRIRYSDFVSILMFAIEISNPD